MRDKEKKAEKGFLASSQFTNRQMIGMLIPLVLDQLFLYLIMLLTTSMISSSSEDSVTAISLVQPLVQGQVAFYTAFATGGSVIIAQYKGHGDETKLKEAIGQTMHLVMMLSLILSLLQYLLAAPMVSWLFPSATAPVKERAVQYLSGMAICNFIHSFRVGSTAALRGVGEIRRNMIGTIIINLSYFIFSYIFLNRLKLDIKGTILSYALARLLGMLTSAYYHFVEKKTDVAIPFRLLLKGDRSYLSRIIRLGIPFSVEELLINAGTLFVSTYLILLGTANVAANAIVSSIYNAVGAPAIAVGMLSATVVGQCIGAGKEDLARWYGKRLVWLGYGLMVLSALIVLPLSGPLLSLYHPQPETGAIARELLLIALGGMVLFFPLSQILPNVLRSAADAGYTTAVSLICMWLLRVGGGYLAAIVLGLGVRGIWLMMAGECLLRGILFLIRFRGKRWLQKSEGLLE